MYRLTLRKSDKLIKINKIKNPNRASIKYTIMQWLIRTN